MARQLKMEAALDGKVLVMERQAEPVTIHGLKASSFVIASFHNELDALLFISAAVPATEQGMCAEYERWVKMEGLEHIDAEELFHQVAAAEQRGADELRQMEWLREFIMRWDGVSRAKGDAFYNGYAEERAHDAAVLAPKKEA